MAKHQQEQPIVQFNLSGNQTTAYYYTQDKTTREILYGGAANAGKTYFGCYFIISSAINYPDTRYLIGRSRLTDLKKSTLVTFFKVLNDLKIESKHYNYNQQENTITFLWNKSTVVLKDLAY